MSLVLYPDDKLSTKCENVVKFDDSLSSLIKTMTEVMEKEDGVGLAAPQVGESVNLFIIKSQNGNILEFVNPIILNTTGSMLLVEGCLSAPNVFLPVWRAAIVEIQYQTSSGEARKQTFAGADARTILHEYDHLDGVFFFSRVSRTLRKQAINKLKKLNKK
jgi:peptide deformylase